MLDHFIYVAPDLDHAVAAVKARLGVRPAAGGSHPGLGTRNAILSLGPDSYLEILAPDPAQTDQSRIFDFASLAEPRMATWVAKAPDLDDRVTRAVAAGFDPGMIVPIEREAPDGATLEWRLTWRDEPAAGGLAPLLIDWCDTPHPASTAPGGCHLLSFYGEHPDPASVRPMLDAMGVNLDLRQAQEPRLAALIEGPGGRYLFR